MKLAFSAFKLPAILSATLVLPFVILELVNRRDFHEDFPVVLFGLLWLLPAAFFFNLFPTIRMVRHPNSSRLHLFRLFASVALLVFLAWLWFALLLDQMPCFLGVPDCD